MKDLAVAVIGAGRLGRAHIHNLVSSVDEARLVAICDANEGLARDLAARYGARPCSDYRQVLDAPDIDAVVVVTPTEHHTEMVLAAASAGKHAFCEKPLAPTAHECRQIAAALAASRVRLQVGYMRRFDPRFREAKDRIEAGEIGRPVLFRSTARDPFPPPPWACDPRRGGGLCMDEHGHDFDLGRWLVKDEVQHVSAMGTALVYREAYADVPGFADHVIINLKFRGGALGQVDGSVNAVYGPDIRTEILGSKGVIFVGGLQYRDIWLVKGEGEARISIYPDDETPSFVRRFNEAYVAELRSFARCVLDDKPTLCGAEDGLRAVQISEAAMESCISQDTISISL